MTIATASASQSAGIRRARFSWHFRTLGRRRWLLVQFVSAPRDLDVEEEAAPLAAQPHAEPPSRDSLLYDFSGEIWRRRSF